jgi:hypothetical protein
MTTNEQTPQDVAKTKATTKKTSVVRLMPYSQYDFLMLAESIVTKWSNTPHITLVWTNVEAFKKLVEEYRQNLQDRMQAGSGRSSQTQTLRELDNQINQAVEEVKLAILAKFGKNRGKAHFAEFAITKQIARFSLAKDRNQRVNALPTFVKAIKAHDLQIVDFDRTFFEELPAKYAAALQEAQQTDSAVSISVGNKNDLREQIESVITCLQWIIRGNYPNTYENELRGWGFHKEKY